MTQFGGRRVFPRALIDFQWNFMFFYTPEGIKSSRLFQWGMSKTIKLNYFDIFYKTFYICN